jgi:hypothetical protein
MNEKLLILFSEATLALAACVGIVFILLSSYYDLLAIKKRRELLTVVARLRGKKQPSVIMFVSAHNNEMTITDCLDSLRRSRYRNYQIIVADNASDDATTRIVRSYIRRHPRLPVRLFTQRRPVSIFELRANALAKLPPVELVLSLDGATTLTPASLKLAVAEMATQLNSSQPLQLRTIRQFPQTIDHLPGRLENFNRNLIQKTLSLSHLLHPSASITTLERYATFTQPHNIKPANRYLSGSIVLTSTPATPTSNQTSSRHFRPTVSQLTRLSALLTFVTVTSYSFYTAATLHTGMLLFLGWLLCTFWVVYLIWSDEAISTPEKIEFSFGAPSLYFLLYVWSIAQLLRILITTIKRTVRTFINSYVTVRKSAKFLSRKIDESRAQ